MPVRYFYQKKFKIKSPRRTAAWIKKTTVREKKILGDISYIFCSDGYLLKLNREFLQHDTLTDILTFDHTVGRAISGEIYISLDRIAENSRLYKVDLDHELLRVMIHGILHLSGYKDKTKADKSAMRKKEEACLSLWKTMFHVKPK